MKLHSFFILLLLATSPLALIEVTSVEEIEVIPNQVTQQVIGTTNGKLIIDPQGAQIRSINVSLLLDVGQIQVYSGNDITTLIEIDVDKRGYYRIVVVSTTVGSVAVRSTEFPLSILIFYGVLLFLAIVSYLIVRRVEVFL